VIALAARSGRRLPTQRNQPVEALSDRSRHPVRHANQLAPRIESRVVSCKRKKPHWGPRKIRDLLVRNLDGDFRVPAKSAIHAVLCRPGLVKALGRPRPRLRYVPSPMSPGRKEIIGRSESPITWPPSTFAVVRKYALDLVVKIAEGLRCSLEFARIRVIVGDQLGDQWPGG
jgi:Homeodomain-like domain